jgi:hypothetical protein
VVRPELDETAPAPATPATPDHTATHTGSNPAGSTSSQLPAGKQLGHFRIERLLGAGGMGEVYLATDLALDRPVAIKVLPEQLARDPKRRERMIREARAQARITHPNVGHMYFIGEADQLYFAMEYVAGKTLAERIEKGPMSVNDALSVVRAAALGLREAQRNGFTHRDVKPSNLMIDGHGVVKVLDFGLAAGDFETIAPGLRPPTGKAGWVPPSGPVAQTSLAGTPLYMAPEQARGEAIDFRADIYALGATLFHLIAGKPPFKAESADELASLHATAARPGLPRRGQPRTQIGAIDALCTKMMAARPEDRFASYDDLLRALELASVTQTRPGGFWARCVAMSIDFTVVGIGFALVETGVERIGGYEVINGDLYLLPLMAVYCALTIARWGSTAGMALIELEVVDIATAERPRFACSLRRSLAMFGPQILIMIAANVVKAADVPPWTQVLKLLFAVSIAAAFFMLLHASARVSGKRAMWDRVAGTMVRYRTTRAVAL